MGPKEDGSQAHGTPAHVVSMVFVSGQHFR